MGCVEVVGARCGRCGQMWRCRWRACYGRMKRRCVRFTSDVLLIRVGWRSGEHWRESGGEMFGLEWQDRFFAKSRQGRGQRTSRKSTQRGGVHTNDAMENDQDREI